MTMNSKPATPARSTETESPSVMNVPSALGLLSISSRKRFRKMSPTAFFSRAQKLPGPFCHRAVHELTRRGLRRGATRLLERPEHLLRPGELLLRRGENLVDDGHLARVDGRLAEEPDPFGCLRLRPKAFVVFQQGMHTVARSGLARRARGDDQVGAGVERLLLAWKAAEVGRQVEAPAG